MWDWGTQPFSTVITTFVFAVYITSASFGNTNQTSARVSTTLAGLFVALAAPCWVRPLTAAWPGHLVTVLRSLTQVLALLSASLFFAVGRPSYLWLGLGLLAVGFGDR